MALELNIPPDELARQEMLGDVAKLCEQSGQAADSDGPQAVSSDVRLEDGGQGRRDSAPTGHERLC